MDHWWEEGDTVKSTVGKIEIAAYMCFSDGKSYPYTETMLQRRHDNGMDVPYWWQPEQLKSKGKRAS
ncbi:MAG: hypothetical protein L0154_03095 [Chloroflexi bacterium]|nr:hypothetical protein [Chloroflexota bacterium]